MMFVTILPLRLMLPVPVETVVDPVCAKLPLVEIDPQVTPPQLSVPDTDRGPPNETVPALVFTVKYAVPVAF